MGTKFSKNARNLMACFIVLQVILVGSPYSVAYAVGGPDFGLTISPTCNVSVLTCFNTEPTQIGLTATYKILYVPFNGFNGVVSENVQGVPNAYFSMGTFFLSQPVTDTLVIGNLSLGTTYQLTVTASTNEVSHSQSTTLTTPKASDNSNSNGMMRSGGGISPDFEMDIAPAMQAPNQMSATYYVTYTPINGFTGPIDEKVTNLPPEFVSFLSSQYDPLSGAGPYGGPMLGPTPTPSFGRCYVKYSGVNHYTCTDTLTIYYNIADGAEYLTQGHYSIVVTAAGEGGFPRHSVVIQRDIPVPEFSGITIATIITLAISICMLRRRHY